VGKNIIMLGGRPLICWVLDAARQCGDVDEVVVSTDSADIAEAAERHGGRKTRVFWRGADTAGDDARTESAMLEFARNADFDTVALIQATSPFLTPEDLSRGFGVLRGGYDSALSVTRQRRFVWSEGESGAVARNYDPAARPRRQDFDGMLVENGAFYITSRERLLASGCRVSGRIGLVEMGWESYFEIDEPHDLLIADAIIWRKARTPRGIRMLLTDCDGVLTDGGIYYTESGGEMKRFYARDGMGFWLMKERGFLTGIVTGDPGHIPQRRAARLDMDVTRSNVDDKLSVINGIAGDYGLTLSQIAYIGDDVNDVAAMTAVGFSACPADAHPDAVRVADYVSPRNGGHGAARDVIDLILARAD
jgi:N-acylneuraminate cytidylyltransferase